MVRWVLTCLVITMALSKYCGQEVEKYRNELSNYEFGTYFFDQHLYGASIQEYEQFLQKNQQPLFYDYDKLRRQALVDKGIAGIRIEVEEAEHDLKELIYTLSPEAIVVPAKLELASYYYNHEKYLDAIAIYDLIEIDELSDTEMSELSFKKGYSYFVNKKFDQAEAEFNRTKDLRNIFYYPANYYKGMVHYFKKEYTKAGESFNKVGNAPSYSPYIPYYISQIYFSEKDYDKLISYAEQKITLSGVENKKEMRLLLGQTYYVRGDFERALPHLEYYESNTKSLTVEEFYQLAFTQYKLGYYEKAKDNFLELTNQDSKLGQMSNYYLADCYTQLKDKTSARTAFKKVSQMDYEVSMSEEALFNYGKLSAELDFEREAINTLISINDNSPYYDEAQGVINDILSNSGDYENSIKIIESLPKLSSKIKATYQNLTLRKGIQSYADNNTVDAHLFLNKSLQYTNDRNYHAQAKYWQAQMANDEGEYTKSKKILDEYFELANGINDMPLESSNFMANYLQAYNDLKLKNYKSAEINFKNAIVGINIMDGDIDDDHIMNRILPDAYLRGADCLFKQNKYSEAKKLYSQVISRKQGSYIYALYQKAMIEGLSSEPYEKILTLEELIQKYPKSEYVDDAYYQMGETYMELGNGEKAAISYIDVLGKFGIKSPYFIGSQLKMGLINYNKGDLNKALYYYKGIFQNNPSPRERQEAIRAIEEIYIQDLAKSEEYFKYRDSIPGMPLDEISKDSLNYHAAENLYNKGDYSSAISAFTNYLVSQPNGYFVHDAKYLRGECYAIAKAYSEAAVDYESLIALNSSKYLSKVLPKAASIAYHFSQDFDKANRYYVQYEPMAKDEVDLYMTQLGILRTSFKLGKDSEVQKYANLVNASKLATIDERASALYYLGKVAYKTKNYTQALASFQQVEKLVSTNQAAESRYLIAEILYQQGKLEDTEKQCNYINESSLNYPYWVAKGLLLMSDVFVDRSDLFNARAAAEAVLENFKDNEELSKISNEKLQQIILLEQGQNRIKVDTSSTIQMEKGN